MGKQKLIITSFHKSTKRSYLQRMNNNKVVSMNKSKKYGFDYWDGKRKFGYGGYKYIPGRLTPLAKKIIKTYKLKNNSKILDVGAGKGYLLYEIKKILPGITVKGLDISSYAIKNSKEEIRKNLILKKAEQKYNFKNKYFDLVISLNCLHNLKIFNLVKALKEIERVGKKSYIVVESFKNNSELFNLQCWSLTCQAFFSKEEWKWIFKNYKFSGDYEFIYFN
ncbi:MAG: class I SAM-dependent methyltransferase [Pseudomonadota bacterium]|nr:class I SAM-dependent methyltransferase [Pseudomonadota bacterium]